MRRFIKVVGLVAALLTLPVTADSLGEVVSQLPEQEIGAMYWEQSKFPQGFKDGFLLMDCGESDQCDFRLVSQSSWVYVNDVMKNHKPRLVAVQEETDRYRIAVLSTREESKWIYSVTPKSTTLLYEGSQLYHVYTAPSDETKCEMKMTDGEEVWTCKEDLTSRLERVFPSVSETGLCYNGYGVVPLEDC